MFFNKKAKQAAEESSTWADIKDLLREEIDFDRDYRVLHVEDEEDERRIMRHAIRKFKQVYMDCVGNGEEALKKLARRRYNLVLIDYQMPLMNGLELLRKIKTYSSVKMILTGMELDLTRKLEIENLGGFYIPKDELERLMNMVAELVDVFKEEKRTA